jgi:hypothetical protein
MTPAHTMVLSYLGAWNETDPWLRRKQVEKLLTLLSAAAATTTARLLSIQHSPEVTDPSSSTP